jgi:outer membrane autotransporter protein
MNIISKKLIIGVSAFVLSLVFISNSSHARQELAFTLTSLNAYSCYDAVYGESGSYFAGNSYYGVRSDYTTSCQAGNTSNASGSVVTATQTLQAATAQTVGVISARISTAKQESAMRKNSDGLSVTALNLNEDGSRGHIGLAGGNAKKGIGVWAQGKWTEVDYSPAPMAFDGDITTAMFGIDKTFSIKNRRILVGLAAGVEDQDMITKFNTGTVKADGFILAPYVSVNLIKGFSVDATVGMGEIDYDFTRKAASNGEVFSGSTSADRYFGAFMVNFNKSKKFSKGVASIGLTVGMNKSRETKDAYEEKGTTGQIVVKGKNTGSVTQATASAEVGFLFKNFEPFINGKYESDTQKTAAPKVGAAQVQPTVDDEGYRIGGGLNLFLGQRGIATIAYEEVMGRSDYEENSVTGRLRFDF